VKILNLPNPKTLLKTIDRIRAGQTENRRAEALVRSILRQVQLHGDRALVRYTRKFDRFRLSPSKIRITPGQIRAAYRKVDSRAVRRLRRAARRIHEFHRHQKTASWTIENRGIRLGQLVRPLDRVGIYVPGGKAAYPSSVLMNALPAKVAGVPEIAMCFPTPEGALNPNLLVAADIAGVTEIFRVGGAQAIGAMAYGTPTIRKVDKIVGPGNLYVALAKKQVSGTVGIDMIAGPSEIVVVADDSAHPEFVAADLLSQAEHDEQAMSVLITTSSRLMAGVRKAMERQLSNLPRRRIILRSLRRFGLMIRVPSLKAAIEAANRIAPEHLELAVRRPERLLPAVRHAGAVFLGHYTTESLGDYVAGPNHVLPTGGTARFASPLSVEDFIKRTSLLSFSKKGLAEVRDTVVGIARLEGLQAHARAVEVRLS
jgi:histidinol dehydrogenase